jgi:phosphatidylglycerophosphate synthase
MSVEPEIERHEDIILGRIEGPILKWLVVRLPGFMTPDWLTSFGLIGNFIIFIGFVLTNISPWYLWLVNLALVISWFGDSMDGTVARYRNQATRHGFYYDHIVDSISAVLICVGWGLSPYIRLDIALYLLIAYLLMSIRAYMYAMVTGEFHIAYAGIGGTEFRVLAFGLNTIAFFVVLPEFQIFNTHCKFYDLIGILMTGSMTISFCIEVIRDMMKFKKMKSNSNT